jgi:phosphoglycolate phosphatase
VRYKASPASRFWRGVKLIIFDLDGTIIDAYKAIEDSFNFTMCRLGLPRHRPFVIRRAVGWGDVALLRPFIPKELIDRAVEIYRNHHMSALVARSKLMSGSIGILKYLFHKDYILAVASNRPTRFSHILLKNLKIIKYFRLVLCADKLRYGKPHPEIILKIMKSCRVNKKETVYIGDMAIDIQAGKRAGVRTIAVLTGSSSKNEIEREKPDYIFKNISYLKQIL